MELTTQTLHRLTSYEPGREWDEAPDDPRVVQGLVTNDMDRLPWFFKRYDDDSLPRIALPRELPTTSASAIDVLAGTAEEAGAATAGRVDADPLEFPLVTAAQRSGDRSTLGAPWERGEPVD